ncbi:MAG: glutamine-hydrolyzing GMP synthase, partial [Gammaproteobacteria bacterium]|nr:glutamine-hydrolyzing GMP synthase [Gammaproteobacteria bacterium]
MTHDIHDHRILIIDFGSQWTQLIARRIREIGVYSEIRTPEASAEEIREFAPKGIILSGGPESVTGDNVPKASAEIYELGVPVLGICYGMQDMAKQLGGRVDSSAHREFGVEKMKVLAESKLFENIEDSVMDDGTPLLEVMMNHGDSVTALPEGFERIGQSKEESTAAMADEKRRFYGVQFHPEVTQTRQGKRLLERFALDICGCEALWDSSHIIDDQVAAVREKVGDGHVILGLSGGVDSSVVAALLHKAIGDQLTCVFVDTGLLRLHEGDQVMATFAEHMGIKVIRVNAEDRFMAALNGVEDPEKKRKIIGNMFIEIFDEEASKIEGADFLAQGTIYPDVIESAGASGKSHLIKS